MDTSKINPFVFLLFPFLFFSNLSFAQIIDLAGSGATWLRDTNSENLMKLTPNSSAVLSGNNLALTEKVNIPTSKGIFSVELQRTAAVDVSRVGRAVGVAARALGPVGIGLAAADAICSLTSICNQAGQWLMNPSHDPALYPSQTNSVESYCTAGMCSGESDTRAPTAAASCKKAVQEVKLWGPGYHYNLLSETGCQVLRDSDNSSLLVTTIEKRAGCPPLYIQAGSICTFTGSNQATTPTESDWANKENLLNDLQFVGTLLEKFYPVPVQAPSITTPQKFPIGNQTTTLKDGNGNTTGTQTTTTEAEITTPSAAENPSGSPSVIRITETSITNNYNINNELTSSTTTTTGGTEKPQQQSYEIEIDNVNPDTLQEKPVSFPFDTNSWGSGSCPADRTVNYHYGSLNLTFQPACDFAVGIKPIVLILAGFVAMYIISGAVRDA